MRGGLGLWLTLIVAMCLRLALASRNVVYQADEVWQYIEPAYGLVTGRSIKTWEFIEGIRGWFIPIMLAAPMAVGHWLAPGGQAHLFLLRAFLALLSLAVPLAFHDLSRPFGKGHAQVAAWVGAIWPEVFYFGVRSSGEGIALSILFPAIAFCVRARRDKHPRDAFLAGSLLVLGAVARFQYLPAIAMLALWACWRRGGRCAIWLIAGALAGMAIGAACDLLAGHLPYAWIWRSLVVNLNEGRSETFGTEPPWWFLGAIVSTWWIATVAVAPLALLGARRLPVLALTACVVLATHSAIPHKEYRFVLLASTALVLLAAIGSVDALDWLARRYGWLRRHVVAIACAGWFGLAVTMAVGPGFAYNWDNAEIYFTTQVLAGEQPGLCGLATYQLPAHPALSYAFVNRPVPMLMFDGPAAAEQAAANHASFNVVIASRDDGASLPGEYRLRTCYNQMDWDEDDQQMCLFVRPGGCTKSSGDFDYQSALQRRGH